MTRILLFNPSMISTYQAYDPDHQQYLAKNPDGYCGIGGRGVPFNSAELELGEKA
jgi:peptide methionine sulfoxide reductase MsrA